VNTQNSQRLYLDYAATTPMRDEAADAMQRASSEGAFNPSSLHAEGRRARALLDRARDCVAAALGASRKEIAFTGSGTEADNLALRGVARAAGRRHVVVSAIEHHAVLHAGRRLTEDGFEVTVVPVDGDGLVDPERFAASLRDDTLLASVMYANNEIGTVQPIAKLAAAARARGALFHTDAVQAVGWLPISMRELGVDMASFAAHKFHGPKGVGILYAREGTPLAPIIEGGGQEFGRRSGTENVAGIAGMAAALELVEAERPERSARVQILRDRLESGILAGIGDVRINGAGTQRLPNIVNVSFAGVDSEALLVRLDLAGIAVSAGSACTSGVLEPSHVIAALHAGDRWQTGVVRFSLGAPTRREDVERVLAVLPGIVADLRDMAGTPA
jgi:cysteine desulfurase